VGGVTADEMIAWHRKPPFGVFGTSTALLLYQHDISPIVAEIERLRMAIRNASKRAPVSTTFWLGGDAGDDPP
jgi:hypothetical protein